MLPLHRSAPINKAAATQSNSDYYLSIVVVFITFGCKESHPISRVKIRVHTGYYTTLKTITDNKMIQRTRVLWNLLCSL